MFAKNLYGICIYQFVCPLKGFTTEISFPESMWRGYIKDYDGANIMQVMVNEWNLKANVYYVVQMVQQ